MRTNKIQGVGINDLKGKIKTSSLRSYGIWKGVLRRCFSNENRSKERNYKSVKVCDEWLIYSNFKKWYDKNYPLNLEKIGYSLELDKDLLSGECKMYSPKTCVFLPRKVNGFLTNKQRTNTSGYIGIYLIKKNNTWGATIRNFEDHGKIFLGNYPTKKRAGKAYLKARMEQAKKVKSMLRDLGYSENIIDLIQ